MKLIAPCGTMAENRGVKGVNSVHCFGHFKQRGAPRAEITKTAERKEEWMSSEIKEEKE